MDSHCFLIIKCITFSEEGTTSIPADKDSTQILENGAVYPSFALEQETQMGFNQNDLLAARNFQIFSISRRYKSNNLKWAQRQHEKRPQDCLNPQSECKF